MEQNQRIIKCKGKNLVPSIFRTYYDAVDIEDHDEIKDSSWNADIGNKFIRVETFVKMPDNKPVWAVEYDYLQTKTKTTDLIVFHDDGSTYVAPEAFDETIIKKNDPNAIAFLVRNLCEYSPFFSWLMNNPTRKNYSCAYVVPGLLKLAEDPKRLTVIETIAKGSGKITQASVGRAIEAIVNNIEYGEGKKKTLISNTQVEDLNKLRLSKIIPIVQDQVQDGVMTIDDVTRFIAGFRAIFKLSKMKDADERTLEMISPSEVERLFTSMEKTIKEKNVSMLDVLEVSIESFFTLVNIENKDRYGRRQTSFYQMMLHYVQTREMLPAHKLGTSKKMYKTDNVERFHAITAINTAILAERRPKEFANANQKLRKLHWENDYVTIRTPVSEDELFEVGQRYNNCLPTYRDKIIDGAIVLFCFDKNSHDTCPDVVFEINPVLDFIQVKTYNDEDVTEGDLYENIKKWKEAKRYLLTGGRTVYRDIESDDETNIVNTQSAVLQVA